MSYLTSILLTGGVIYLSYCINQGNIISTLIGAICLGVYNGIYYHKVWDKYLCYQDKKVKIEPHMDLSGIGEPCKDLRFGHNIFKMFRAEIFNHLIGYNNEYTKEDNIRL